MVKPTRIDPARAIPSSAEVPGVVDDEDVDWDTGPADDVVARDQWKQPVRAATTGTITISTALNPGDTLDGVTLADGDRVLVKDQSSAAQNGIYVAGSTPARAPDMDDDTEVLGAVVYVIAGTANASTAWKVENTAATIVGTDAIDWAAFGGGGGGVTVEDEGTPLATTATTLDFVGAGVTASGTGAEKTITIPGGITVEEEGTPLATSATTLDFVGGGVTASGTGAEKTITIPGGIASGTSFPGSPTTNDMFFRTDRGLLYYHDGTRWLSVNQYHAWLGQWSNITASTGANIPPWAAIEITSDIFLGTMYVSTYSSGLSGSAYWTIELIKYDGATPSSVATISNQSGANSVYERRSTTVNALLGTSMDGMEISATKVSTPGALYAGAFITYRLVG